MSQPVKRSRISNSKVRTGCITCKIRRVKCDEVKPHCLRCTRAGRKCSGYASPPPSARSAIGQSTASGASSKENRAIDFFYHKTSLDLAGFFGASFWKGCILQLSLTEPCIRYAVMAISTLHEEQTQALRPSKPRAATDLSTTPALQLYNRALNALSKKVSTGPDAIPVVLVACIALICFESLRGRPDVAVTHTIAGINLLHAHRQSHGHPTGHWGRKYDSFESSFIETELAPTLSSLNISTMEFSYSYKPTFLNGLDPSGLPIMSSQFCTMQEARVVLIDMVTATSIFLNPTAASLVLDKFVDAWYIKREGPEFLRQVGLIRDKLDHWKVAYDDLLQRRQALWSVEEKHAASSVLTMWYALNIGLSLFTAKDADEFDYGKAMFEKVIEVIESMVSNTDTPAELPDDFTFEVGLIFPLHAVAWKCRWPRLRRRALALLLQIPRRECFFNAVHHYTLFKRIMEIEEASLNLSPGVVPGDDDLPPLNKRVRHFFITPRPQPGRNICSVVFLTKPDGLKGPWHSTTELLDFGDLHVGETAMGLRSMVPVCEPDGLKVGEVVHRALIHDWVSPSSMHVVFNSATGMDRVIEYGARLACQRETEDDDEGIALSPCPSRSNHPSGAKSNAST